MSKILFSALALVISATAGAGAGEWTSVGIPGGRIQSVDYIGPGVAIAATAHNLYRTTNHGAAWALLRPLPANTTPSVAANPAKASQVLVVAGQVLRSINQGETFAAVDLSSVGSSNTVYGVAVFSHDGSNAYIVTTTGACLRSGDGGATWIRLTGVLPAITYTSIDRDASDPATLYVTGFGGVLHRSRDACATWTRLNGARNLARVTASRSTSGVVIALDMANQTTTRSVDYGSTWTLQATPQLLSGFQMLPGGRAVTGGGAQANVFTSNDDGLTWADRGRRLNDDIGGFAYDPAQPERLLAATDAGVIGSDDGGATWTERLAGMNEADTLDIVTSRDASNSVYIATSDLSSVYRRDPATGTFAAVARQAIPLLEYPRPFAGVSEYRLAVSPANGNTLYMIRAGRVGRSNDGGATWSLLSNTSPLKSITIDPANTQVLYAGGFTANLKSVDGGSTWAPLPGSLPASVTRIVVDPVNTANVVAMADQYGPAATALYKSPDAGVTWARLPLPAITPFLPYTVAMDPVRPATLYLSQLSGMQKSTDGGTTWANVVPGAGFAATGYHDLVVDPGNPDIVYAANPNAQLIRSVDGGNSWAGVTSPAAAEGFGFQRVVLVPGHNARLIGLRHNGGVYELDVTPTVNLSLTGNSMTATQSGVVQIAVRNDGTPAATRVRVSGTLPLATGAYAVQGSGLTCAVAARELTCDAATLLSGANATASVTFTPSASGSATLTLAAYETLASASVSTAAINVAAAPSSSSSSGGGSSSSSSSGGGSSGSSGGGGGRFDYLLLLMLSGAVIARGATRRLVTASR